MIVKLIKHHSPVEGNYVGLYVNGKPVQYIYGVTEATLEEGENEWVDLDSVQATPRGQS